MFARSQNRDLLNMTPLRNSLLEHLEKSSKEVGRQSRNSLITNRKNIEVANKIYESWQLKQPTTAEIIKIAEDPATTFFVRLKLLFFLRRQHPWRQWTRLMQYILHSLQLSICHDSSLLQQLQNLTDFQQEIHRLLDLTCNNLQSHLVILLQTMLQFNPIYRLFDQNKLSLRMVTMAKQIPALRVDVLWTIVESDFDGECIVKILEWPKESMNDRATILPILTMLANYIVKTDANSVRSMLANRNFQTLISSVLNCNSKYEQIRELQLLINNCLVKSIETFIQVSRQTVILRMLLQHLTEERPLMCSILVEGHKTGIGANLDQQIIEQAYRSIGNF